MKNLKKYGATDRYIQESSLYNGFLARIISQNKNNYKIATNKGEFLATLTGKFIYETESYENLPAVGDFVIVSSEDDSNGAIVITQILRRKNILSRKYNGKNQIIGANLDLVFICMSLNNNFNINRLERFLEGTFDNGINSVVLLTKSDLCDNVEYFINQINDINPFIDVLPISMIDNDSINKVKSLIKPHFTISLIGSSGVGKSTLINSLSNDLDLETKEIRKGDDKGKHTTTRRDLYPLPFGGVIIDNPGIREFGLSNVNNLSSFDDIEILANQCKFANCTHTSEPNCAVLNAIKTGDLDKRRYDSYIKLKNEVSYENLNSKQIEKQKINRMFSEFGGLKNSKKARKNKF